MSKVAGIIPARWNSTRFPGKPLHLIAGKPLLQHVWERCCRARVLDSVIIATDEMRIAEAAFSWGAEVSLTMPRHASGTDRIAEVAGGLNDEIIVNVQGDEPEIEPATIDALIERLQKSNDDMATAATPFPTGSDPTDPNLVKVIVSSQGYAIYFSRLPIPFYREPGDSRAYNLHLGIYAYRRNFLMQFSSWPQTVLEKAEKLEQLRAIENGKRIYVLKISRPVHGIDTEQQYQDFVKRYKGMS